MEPQQIDVGAAVFDRASERELVLQNNGKVPFEFRLLREELSRPGIVECYPEKGLAAAGQHVTVKLKVRLYAALPLCLSWPCSERGLCCDRAACASQPQGVQGHCASAFIAFNAAQSRHTCPSRQLSLCLRLLGCALCLRIVHMTCPTCCCLAADCAGRAREGVGGAQGADSPF